jgi:cobalt-zinc-cadmium resistance protein CzcA
VVIGGILSSTFLTLLVLPVLYRIFHRETTPNTATERRLVTAPGEAARAEF